ncbi:hypothetical protein HJG60_010078 [Phyllostomus discolor]|uniref:Uncharacterized protein n=1 Tax=Phyllostomus discolor TaxID=89673 RepID=A0A834AXR4_9CHIR|nr:hypothetical protein HJG60_010078 [Phyllostomus discolor]
MSSLVACVKKLHKLSNSLWAVIVQRLKNIGFIPGSWDCLLPRLRQQMSSDRVILRVLPQVRAQPWERTVLDPGPRSRSLALESHPALLISDSAAASPRCLSFLPDFFSDSLDKSTHYPWLHLKKENDRPGSPRWLGPPSAPGMASSNREELLTSVTISTRSFE